MNIFAYPQYSSCVNYDLDSNCGFTYWELNEGDAFIQSRKENNHIIFIITGLLSVDCDQFNNVYVQGGQMIFLPNKSDCSYRCMSASQIVVFTFDRLRNQCDKYAFQNWADKAGYISYVLRPVIIRELLRDFILLLVEYIQNGLNCTHLHEEKEKELFILLRACYTQQEMQLFFYPLITHNVDFRQTVLDTYPQARNVKELAQLTGYNISDFRNKFLADFGEPVYQWMQKRKSSSVKFKLMTDNTDIATISNEFGFSSPAHFNKFCKKQFGMTPALLRKQLRQKI